MLLDGLSPRELVARTEKERVWQAVEGLWLRRLYARTSRWSITTTLKLVPVVLFVTVTVYDVIGYPDMEKGRSHCTRMPLPLENTKSLRNGGWGGATGRGTLLQHNTKKSSTKNLTSYQDVGRAIISLAESSICDNTAHLRIVIIHLCSCGEG